MSMFGFLGDALGRGAAVLDPLFGGAAVAVTIVLCTLAVRAALHPLARAAARGEKARAALAPQLAALQRKHKNDPERLQKAMADLYARTGASPLAGCLPMLLQLPVFFVMYHLFSTRGSGLLDHTLLGAPLGGRWSEALADGGPFGPQGLVYLALFVLVAAVATWNYRRARATRAQAPAPDRALPGTASMAKLMPLLSYGTLITVAVVPLAAGLYMVTTTTWTACERALLQRDKGDRRSTRQKQRQGDAPAAEATDPALAKQPADAPADSAPPVATPTPRRVPQQRAPKSRAARQRAARARANAQARTRSDAPTRRPLAADAQARTRAGSGDAEQIITTAQ
ncbi:YidC/Oxa1 family membrane protein insertase [Streptomyces endophytica]|uniref:Membrane protein insertase YidC n=1 Tax=Streptomyces endophytica TaxID=2991496 RepID=A0ABY6PBL2_9ACTN|nr:membrane protein insertase YidC [Streptomyces endophytica]UZJ31228.1 YidC/Oxa1 family membrane protein insertase [Streptomyces endophytica]